MDYGDGDHLYGRLGLHAAVWRHRLKSASAASYRLNSGPRRLCDVSASEGGMRKCGAIYKLILPTFT